jgi:hypothetical protein
MASTSICFPVRDRATLRSQLAPSAIEALDLDVLPDQLFPVIDIADLARKQLAAKIWRSRLSDDARRALYELIPPAPTACTQTAQLWRSVFWFVFVPPGATLSLQGSRTFKWRMYGGGLPFYQEGWSDAYGEARLGVGWGISFVSVDCLLAPGETVRDQFVAFPAETNLK